MSKELIKIIVWLVAGIAILTAEVVLVKTPSNQKKIELEAELDILRGKTKRGVEEIKIINMEQAVDSLTAVLIDIKDRLYPAEEFDGLGKAIQKSGTQLSLQLIDVKPDYPKLKQLNNSSDEVVELPVTITLRGKFLQFARFLEHLSEFPYVKALEISIRHTENHEATIDGIIYGQVIFKKVPVINEETSHSGSKDKNVHLRT